MERVNIGGHYFNFEEDARLGSLFRPNLSPARIIRDVILDSYTLDFAKHAPASDIPKLSLVWESLPAELARKNNKFVFSVIKEGARAREWEPTQRKGV